MTTHAGHVAAEILLLSAMGAILFSTASILHLAPMAATFTTVTLLAAGRGLVLVEHRARRKRRV